MPDEQKSAAPQTGPAGQPQKGVQIRTMKSDIEALQKKPGVAPTPALKPAISAAPKPPILPIMSLPPVKPISPLPAGLPVGASAQAGAVPAPKPAVSLPAGGLPPVPVMPAAPRPPIFASAVPPVKSALPPVAPVAVPKPIPPAAGIPLFRPVVPSVLVKPAAPMPALPAEISAEEGGRERIMFLAKRIAFFGGLAIVIGGIAGIVIYYLVSPAAPLAPKTPAALFSVDDIKIIDLGQEPKKVLMEEIKTLGAEPLGSEKSFTQILFKTETEKCFTLKRNCVIESRYLEPEEIYGILGAAVPPYLSGLANDDFTLFVYNQDGSPRFGAVILVSDSEAAFADISAEESGLAGYWELLTGAAFPSPEGYKDSVYQNINIRYLNLPDPYLAVDYASYPARNYLLFATSRESIFALVDKLFAMEGK